MAAFEYTALTTQGRQRKGVMEGDTARQIRSQLREQSLIPISIETIQGSQTTQQTNQRNIRSISATDLALITRQLATLVHSALPIEEALQVVSKQTSKPRLKSLLLAIRSKVVEGHTLAAGMSQFPHIFPELYRSTVAAGEQSGHLDVVLERLADYTENRQKIRQKISIALFYPVILTTVALLVVIALLTYVVPEVVQVFANTKQQLPLLTRGLIFTSDFLKQYGLLLLILFSMLGFFLRWWLQKPVPRFKLHQLLLKLPIISSILTSLETARFARTLSILSASGVSLLEALKISAQVISNLPMRKAVSEAAIKVREGTSLHLALDQAGYFPPMTVHLIASGEASGQLETMLSRTAEHQEQELEAKSAMILGLFEPLMILMMGGIVLVIVLAILLPIFELNQLVQ